MGDERSSGRRQEGEIRRLRKKVRDALKAEPFFKLAERTRINPLSLAIFAGNFAKTRQKVIDQLRSAFG